MVVLSLVVLVESVLFLSKTNNKTENNVEQVSPTVTVSETDSIVAKDKIINFSWLQKSNNKMTLVLQSSEDVAVDAIDLEMAYEGVKVLSVVNAGVLPEPSKPIISRDKSLIVTHYLIDAMGGFKLNKNEKYELLDINYSLIERSEAKFTLEEKTLVVESVTSKVLPYSI